MMCFFLSTRTCFIINANNVDLYLNGFNLFSSIPSFKGNAIVVSGDNVAISGKDVMEGVRSRAAISDLDGAGIYLYSSGESSQDGHGSISDIIFERTYVPIYLGKKIKNLGHYTIQKGYEGYHIFNVYGQESLYSLVSEVKEDLFYRSIHLNNFYFSTGNYSFASNLDSVSGVGDLMEDTDGDGYLEIYTCNQLQNVAKDLSANYELMRDIDCSGTPYWNGGQGFVPIGSYVSSFAGNFNGNGYIIKNLYIRSSQTYSGLFGYQGDGKEIINLGLLNARVIGTQIVGGIVGRLGGSINNTYFSGNLISLATDDSSGVTLGVLAGEAYEGTSILNSYGVFTFEGFIPSAKGLIGHGGAEISGLYWDISSGWDSFYSGGTGLTTAQMKNASTFRSAGWDENIWNLTNGYYLSLKKNNYFCKLKESYYVDVPPCENFVTKESCESSTAVTSGGPIYHCNWVSPYS